MQQPAAAPSQPAVPQVMMGQQVIWSRDGSAKYSNGLVATVVQVYDGVKGLDLMVMDRTGMHAIRNIVAHQSLKAEVNAARIRDSGLWCTLTEHHAEFLREAAEAAERKAKQKLSDAATLGR